MHTRQPTVTRVLGACLALFLSVSCRDLREAQGPDESQVLLRPQAKVGPVASTGMLSPVRITQATKGKFLVSDILAGAVFRVRVRSGDLVVERALEIPGRPLGVAWAGGNRLLVGNATTRSVDVYRAGSGRWLYSLGKPGTVSDPKDIAIDSRENLAFVLDGAGRTVQVFDLKSRSLRYTFPGPGMGEEDGLQNPTGITTDESRREVLVSDYGDLIELKSPPSVKIYSYGGEHLRTISGKGSGMLGEPRFSRPQGLAVDAVGRILVVDALAGEVLVLDRETGDVLETLGSLGSGPGQLWLPLDVVVDDKLNAYVTNNRPRRVEVLSLGGSVP